MLSALESGRLWTIGVILAIRILVRDQLTVSVVPESGIVCRHFRSSRRLFDLFLLFLLVFFLLLFRLGFVQRILAGVVGHDDVDHARQRRRGLAHHKGSSLPSEPL